MRRLFNCSSFRRIMFLSKSLLSSSPSSSSSSPFLFSPPPPPSLLRPLFFASSSSFSSSSSSSSSGEVHVIVGPMFAGKTTTLLRRIQSQRLNGSFQASQHSQLNNRLPLLDKTLKDLCYSGRLSHSIQLLWRTPVSVHSKTYALLLQECIHRHNYQWAKTIHAHMLILGFSPNQYLQIKLLILYAKKGMEDVGLALYHTMRNAGLTPDQFTFASVFRACATLALLQQGKQAHALLLKCRIGQNVVVNSALIDMYFKCSCPFDGHRVFSNSENKNVVTWTALISGYGHNGNTVEVLELFHEMIEQGFRPNYVTFLAVLSACSHGGLVKEGWKYFSLMKKDYGIQPHDKHYAVMVDLLGRAGRLGEAYNFIKDSPCKENPVVWGSLLGACRTHGNVELLKLSAKKFFDLEPENAGKYVVLSNSYASHGLWEDVAEVWGLMKDSGVKKDPAYSKIEVQNEVHVFFKGDNTHKHAQNTFQMLKELTCVIKDRGFNSDLTTE